MAKAIRSLTIPLLAAILQTALPGFPQSTTEKAAPSAPASSQAATPPSAHLPHQPPCWQQVGISKSVIEQRHIIEENTRSQVAAVCADSSLTAPQKKEKIKEIREQARSQVEALIPAQQLQELKACNEQRMAAHPQPARKPASSGPCGNLNSPPTEGPASPPSESEPKP